MESCHCDEEKLPKTSSAERTQKEPSGGSTEQDQQYATDIVQALHATGHIVIQVIWRIFMYFLIALHKSQETKTSHFVTSPVFTNIMQPYQTGPPPPAVIWLGLYCVCAQALLYLSFCLISSMLCRFFPVVSNIRYFQIMALRFKIPESWQRWTTQTSGRLSVY